MTNAQKVIKLCAQAFAIFLIFTIISAVLTGFYGIGMAINGKNKENDSKDIEIISCENYNDALNEVIINTMYSDLEIKKSDTFKIESNNEVKCKANNGTIKIEDKNKWKKNKLIVYLPSLSKLKIDTGAGSLDIEEINANNIKLSLGAGLTTIKNIIASTAKIDTGAGKLVIENSIIEDFDFDMGVGSAEITTNIANEADIDAGVGSLKLNLIGSKMEYMLKISKGIGNIVVDGEKIKSDEAMGNGGKDIKIDGGVGSIKVDFTEK